MIIIRNNDERNKITIIDTNNSHQYLEERRNKIIRIIDKYEKKVIKKNKK